MAKFNAPTENELKEWAGMTDRNDHLKVRMEVAKWAKKNTDNAEMKSVIGVCQRSIDRCYHSDRRDWLDTACKVTNIMIRAIEVEYGKPTADLIVATL